MAVTNHAPAEIAAGIKRASTHSQNGNEVFFSVKHNTQLKKLMNAYCDRRSVEMNAIAFLFDWLCLRAKQTLDELIPGKMLSNVKTNLSVNTYDLCGPIVPSLCLFPSSQFGFMEEYQQLQIPTTSEDEVMRTLETMVVISQSEAAAAHSQPTSSRHHYTGQHQRRATDSHPDVPVDLPSVVHHRGFHVANSIGGSLGNSARDKF
ncbi:small ubiquitin-related modifier 1 [Artemisia annua]|uniref:Small ubiquitin-related modifier 1 n=1 Tax=Artemisia annua TaxID=35608 RepID=A0A2U1KQQ5_ARTAN|nr:small ubiquitin-related modifier 1 [Artemisia annua]